MSWEKGAWDRYIAICKNIDEGADLEQYNVVLLSNLYLLSSYLYYELSADPIMSDPSFDRICKHLHANYHKMQDVVWWVATLFPKDSLAAGTGYHLTGKYPPAIGRIAEAGLSSQRRNSKK